MDRPYVLLSCAMSLDGYIDDASDVRLVLSSAADLDRVDEVRAGCDAILVGAGTIRADNPRLLLHSQARRETRIAAGLAPNPAKVTITATGDLDPAARFFSAGEATVIVYVASGVLEAASRRLGDRADVIDAGEPVDLAAVLADLAGRGVKRLMVEGGSSTITQFLRRGLGDELQLAIAPLFVGDSRAPRFAGDGSFSWNSEHRAKLAGVSQVGDDAVLTFALSGRFGE